MTSTKTRTVGGSQAPHDHYLAPAEVARVLDITREYAGRLMRTGAIPGVVDLSSGGRRALLRVRRSDLQTWVDSRAL